MPRKLRPGPSIFPDKSRLKYLGRSKKGPARMVIKRNPSDSLLHQMKGGIPYLNLQKGFSLEFTFIQHFKYVNIKRNESNHFLRGSVNKRVVPFPRTIIIKRRKIFFGDQPPPPPLSKGPPIISRSGSGTGISVLILQLSLSLSQFHLIFMSFVAILSVKCRFFKAMSLVEFYPNRASISLQWRTQERGPGGPALPSASVLDQTETRRAGK